jgi:hypothetical protein
MRGFTSCDAAQQTVVDREHLHLLKNKQRTITDEEQGLLQLDNSPLSPPHTLYYVD